MKHLIRLTSAIVLVALLLGVVSLAGVSAQEDDLKTVRVGITPILIYAPMYVADARGYFAEEGISVEFLPQAGGAEPLAPLARGELEVIIGGTGAGFYNYAARNIDTNGDPGFRVVAGGHIERPPATSSLVVSKERYDSGELTSVADLAGKRVAINAAGAATEYWMVKALEQGGLTLDDVELIAIPFQDMPAALNSSAEDRLDAAILGEPIAAGAEAQDLIARLSEDFIDGFQPTFVYMATDFIENDRATAEGFMRAYLKASRDLQDPQTWRDEDIVAHLSEVTFGYSESLLDFYAFPYYEPDGTVHLEDMELLQDYFLVQEDALAYDEALDINALVDDSLLEAALETLGAYEAEE